MRFTWRPIDKWDREETTERKHTPFDASYSQTLQLLDRELRMIDAENVVVMADVRETDIRIDGLLRERATPRTPRIILAFDSQHGPLKYACDRFTHWQANLRAIALGLEALRRVERYGIAGRGEQYTGWAQLGSGIAMSAGMSRREAVAVLIDLTSDGHDLYSDDDLDDQENPGRPGAFLEDAYRIGAKRWHPDNEGGDGEKFYLLTKARDVLASG